ncbi:hypothetical protein [Soonwooa sp.]|uniref:hypothetical protein n=1 Tax=Soonwooa sp. TaxID=1938592 RepID=UPI00260CE0B6|nr:hypothetical protein [Soonwooa sp.]
MKTYNFRQNPGAKAVIFAIVYFAVVFSICYFAFGGINGMADKVNNVGSGKIVGVVVGFAFLAPFIILLQYVSPKIKVELGQDFLSIKTGSKQQNVSFAEIGTMILNDKKINTLKLLDRSGNLISDMSCQSSPTALSDIATEISKSGFNKEKSTLNFFGKDFDRITYRRI